MLADIAKALHEGREQEVLEKVGAALDEHEAEAVLNEGLLKGMDLIGTDFKSGKMFVPEVLMAARTMHGAMEILKPHLAEGAVKFSGSVVIGTVAGDLHDIGKNLVIMMLEAGGFQVIDLGVDVSSDDFVKAVKDHSADLVGMSALLTTTMPEMEKVIQALDEAGVRDAVSILVGGAPVTREFASEIGADGYASNASTALDLARDLVAKPGGC